MKKGTNTHDSHSIAYSKQANMQQKNAYS